MFLIGFDWIGVSYKGSTKVFGSFSRGSIPLAPTKTHGLIYRNTNYLISDIKGKGKGITCCCCGFQKSAYGFHWKYVDDTKA